MPSRMERRQILLGSGTALATVLAGCSSDETDNDSNSDGTDGQPPADDDTADTGDGATGTDGTKKDKDKTDGTHDDKDKTDDSNGDVPGLDDELTIDSWMISVTDISRDGDELTVVATTTTTNSDALRDKLESIASDMSDAVTDPEAFADAIDRVSWVLKHDGTTILSFYVDTQWVRKYSTGAMSREAFTDRVLETVEQP